MTRTLVLLLGLALLLPAAAGAKRKMRLGYVDTAHVVGRQDISLPAARRGGARVVRVNVPWRLVAPQPPAAPTDPRDPAYSWDVADSVVDDIRDAGLQPMITISRAPAWAEGAGRPESAVAGSWRPDPRALGDFFRAAARHYSGRTPGVGRVRLWQVWNEPNLASILSPQSDAPRHYRRMLNAGYRGVKRVMARATVVTAGTAPYGDESGNRTRPVKFWRELLCVRGDRLRRTRCPGPARFDVWSHHPYGIRGPSDPALNADDAAIPDLGKIDRVVKAAVKRRTVRPRGPKQAWVTEFSWDSSPPDPEGVPARTHARWLTGALFEFWRAGVTTALWFQILDQDPNPSFGATFQSGTHLADGQPKTAALAYAFPFATGEPRRRTIVWGLAPRRGRVAIQRRRGERWRTVERVRASRGRVFTARLRTREGMKMRAKQRSRRSLTWRVGVDPG